MIVFGSEENTSAADGEETTLKANKTEYPLWVGYLTAWLAAITISFNVIVINQMKELHFSVIQVWNGVLTLLFLLAYMIYDLYVTDRFAYKYQSNDWTWQDQVWYTSALFGANLISYCASSLMTIANQ